MSTNTMLVINMLLSMSVLLMSNLWAPVTCDIDTLACDIDAIDEYLIGVTPVTNETVCYPADRHALLLFKAGITADPNNALASWSSSAPDCCSWNGVTCDGTSGRVVSLDVSRSSLNGSVISGSLGSLSALQLLKLYGNTFAGTSLPSSLGNLSSLRKLCLSSCGFSGSIPSSLGRLAHLQMLDLSYNSLSGSLPSSIGNLSSLQELTINGNQIGGSIPGSFARLSNLYIAGLGSNRISGRIPDSFNEPDGLVSLMYLYLDNNRITGVPRDLSNLKNLQLIDLQYNPIRSLDNVAGLLTSPQLVEIDLSNCQLSGSGLARWLARGYPRANTLHISDEVTPSLGLGNNALSGSIPENIGTLLPDYIQGLGFDNNQFSGHIPSSLSNLTSLTIVELQRNELTGSIPDTFSKLSNLVTFNVSYNHLSGQVPPVIPFTTLDISSYEGNAGLCGTPLPSCT